MDFLTHIIIALKVKNSIKKELKIRLNTAGFLFGNVKPDISPKYIKIEHYKRDSNSFLQNEIHQILDLSFDTKKITTAKFSEKLGIITHYLSDFFCYVHSEHFTGSIKDHYLYEFNMLFKYLSSSKTIDRNSLDVHSEISISKASILDHIEALNEKYLSVCNWESPETDMIYTLQAVKYLCFSVLTTCLSQEEQLGNTHLLPA